ncbi:MAG: type I-E CRISPR-associated protein Cas7/Cse4/CasC [Armatimonadetes bacterium]|nr:type I-E CRISPR-associated protein Cas7/Cse4/CasC [Armatimonadota bacterium]
MKIELHVLQNFAPSCLNRDDTNTPKSCQFGGVTRARISSQCAKRAERRFFQENNLVETGARSKRMKQEVSKELQNFGQDPDILSRALTLFIEAYYSKMDSKRPDETAVLLYWSALELREIAQCIRDLWAKGLEERARELLQWEALSKEAQKKQQRPKWAKESRIEKRLKEAGLTSDIALFGRMLAEQPDINVDAACQVAHPIATHATDLEMDFFTAVDDLNQRDETGAGMLGVTGYQSACFYRYALLDFDQLLRNLKGERAMAETTVEAFLRSFTLAVPAGKQNSMAAHNPPSFAMFIVRSRGVPCSLANAFVRPILPHSDLIESSMQALASYWSRMNRLYNLYGGASISLLHDRESSNALGDLEAYDKLSLQEAIQTAMSAVRSPSPEPQP